MWGPRPPFGPEWAHCPTLGDSYSKVPRSSPVSRGGVGGGVVLAGAGRGAAGAAARLFLGSLRSGGSSVTKSRGGARPPARGTEGSGRGEHPPLGRPSLHTPGTPRCPPGERPSQLLVGLEMLLRLAYCKGARSVVRGCLDRAQGRGGGQRGKGGCGAAAPVPTAVGPHVQSSQAPGWAVTQVSGSCSRCE